MLWQVSVGTKLQGVPDATVAREAAPLPRRRVRPKDALLALAYPRQGEPFAELAAGFGVGTTTASTTTRLLALSDESLHRSPHLHGHVPRPKGHP